MTRDPVEWLTERFRGDADTPENERLGADEFDEKWVTPRMLAEQVAEMLAAPDSPWVLREGDADRIAQAKTRIARADAETRRILAEMEGAGRHGRNVEEGFIHGEGCDGLEHVAWTCPEHMAPQPMTEAGQREALERIRDHDTAGRLAAITMQAIAFRALRDNPNGEPSRDIEFSEGPLEGRRIRISDRTHTLKAVDHDGIEVTYRRIAADRFEASAESPK